MRVTGPNGRFRHSPDVRAQFTQRSLKKNGWLRIDKRRKLSSPTNVGDGGVGPNTPEGHCFHPFEFSTV